MTRRAWLAFSILVGAACASPPKEDTRRATATVATKPSALESPKETAKSNEVVAEQTPPTAEPRSDSNASAPTAESRSDGKVEARSSPPTPNRPTNGRAAAPKNDRPVDVHQLNQPFRKLKNEQDVREWVDKFENESREIWTKRVEVADAVGLKEGQRIADVGAGTGLFEPLFSARVGETGKVYAVDIAQPFLDHIARKAGETKLTNVVTVKCSDDATGLEKNSVDVVFVCDTYHHFEHPEKNLASIRESLVDGGELVVVDFEKIAGKSRDFVMHHVRAPKVAVLAELEAAGFELVREEKILDENYLVVLRKAAPK